MIPVFRPLVRRAEMNAVLERLVNDAVGPGSVSERLAVEIARFLGRRGGIAYRSLPVAYDAALRCVAVQPSETVVISALAPTWLRDMIAARGAVARVSDVQPDAPVLPASDFVAGGDVVVLEAHLGFVPPLSAWKNGSARVIEDVSTALGGAAGATLAGSVGECAVVGLEDEHSFTAGGGAVVVTNTAKRIEQLEATFAPATGQRHLPDLNAALALSQINRVGAHLERRRELAERFARSVARGGHVGPYTQDDASDPVFAAFPVMVAGTVPEVRAYAKKNGVETTLAFADSIALDAAGQEAASAKWPNAESFARRTVLFPLSPSLSTAEAEKVERVLGSLP